MSKTERDNVTEALELYRKLAKKSDDDFYPKRIKYLREYLLTNNLCATE